MSRLHDLYSQTLKVRLKTELGLANVHQVPKLTKVVVAVGLGKGLSDQRYFEVASNTVRKITGQQPIATRAARSIAGFKLREGAQVGLKVTLRGERMYEFVDRLVNLVLPRTRDFRGLSAKAFDGAGNYHLGLADQSVFPELTYDETTLLHGLQITLVIDTPSVEASRRLLESFGFPFEKEMAGATKTKAEVGRG